MSAYTLFATAIGTCGLGWGSNGITGVQLPESNQSATLARLLRKLGGSASVGIPTAGVQQVIDDIVALLAGNPKDLRGAVLDMSQLPAFLRDVYAIVRLIDPGQTMSYGEVADRSGNPGAARAVGQAMARNPFPIIVPCHRVLAAHGKSGGFSANGGVHTKMRLLAIEGTGNLFLPW
jgi:methylated-DNA-[protein]-cysteine S-methyltransferase